MSAKNKIRGNVLEVETVKLFESHGLAAKRAWGSNGKSMDQHEEVDVLVPKQIISRTHLSDDGKFVQAIQLQEIKIQCKRKKELPEWLGFTKHVDAVVVREDRGRKFIMMDLEDFITRFLK